MTCPSCRAHQIRAVAMRRVALQATQQVTDPRRRRDLNRLITAIGEDLPNRDATIRALTSLAVRGYTQRHHDGTWGLTSIGHATIHQPEADT